MGVERAEFQIPISFPINATGANQAVASMNQMGDAAKRASAAASQPGATNGINDLKHAHDEATESVDKHTFSQKQLRKAIHGVGLVAPELALALQAAVNPITGAIVASILILGHYKEEIDKIDESLQKLNEEEFAKHVDRLHEQRMGLVNAALAMEEYRAKLQEAADKQQSFAEILSQSVSEEKEHSAAITAVADAEKEARLSALEAFHAAGVGSERAYQAARLEIERQAAAARRKIAYDEQVAEMTAKMEAVNAAKKEQEKLKPEVAEKTKAASLAEGVVERKEKAEAKAMVELEESRADLDTFLQKLSKKDAEFFSRIPRQISSKDFALESWDYKPGPYGPSKKEALRRRWASPGDPEGFGGYERENEPMWRRWEKYTRLNVRFEQNVKRSQQSPEVIARAKINAAQAKRAADEAAARTTENEDFIRKSEREIELENKRLERQAALNQKLDELDKQKTGNQNFTAWAKEKKKVNDLQDKPQITGDEQGEINEFNSEPPPSPPSFPRQPAAPRRQAPTASPRLIDTGTDIDTHQLQDRAVAALGQRDKVLSIVEQLITAVGGQNARVESLATQVATLASTRRNSRDLS
jgi:hypothetical protein